MYRQFFQGLENLDLPLFALALFFTFFLVVVTRLFVLRRSSDFASVENLPLGPEEPR
jgi:hypothetical protein